MNPPGFALRGPPGRRYSDPFGQTILEMLQRDSQLEYLASMDLAKQLGEGWRTAGNIVGSAYPAYQDLQARRLEEEDRQRALEDRQWERDRQIAADEREEDTRRRTEQKELSNESRAIYNMASALGEEARAAIPGVEQDRISPPPDFRGPSQQEEWGPQTFPLVSSETGDPTRIPFPEKKPEMVPIKRWVNLAPPGHPEHSVEISAQRNKDTGEVRDDLINGEYIITSDPKQLERDLDISYETDPTTGDKYRVGIHTVTGEKMWRTPVGGTYTPPKDVEAPPPSSSYAEIIKNISEATPLETSGLSPVEALEPGAGLSRWYRTGPFSGVLQSFSRFFGSLEPERKAEDRAQFAMMLTLSSLADNERLSETEKVRLTEYIEGMKGSLGTGAKAMLDVTTGLGHFLDGLIQSQGHIVEWDDPDEVRGFGRDATRIRLIQQLLGLDSGVFGPSDSSSLTPEQIEGSLF
jgi:hypothetical protein